MIDIAPGWTKERVAELRRLWEEGYTAAYIASCLGGISRSGVLGKLHRLGLSGRIVQTTPKPKPQTKTAPAKAEVTPEPVPRSAPADDAAPKFKAEPLPAEPAPLRPGITLEDLKPRSCCWPQGDPNKPSFRFCGARTEAAGDAYCKAHADIAFPDRGKPKKPKRTIWNSDFLTKLQRFKDSGQSQADAAKMLGTSEAAVGAAARKYLGGWAS